MSLKHFSLLATITAVLLVAVNCGILTQHADSVPENCLKRKPIQSNYTPEGSEITLGNLTIYETTEKNSTRLIISIYDAFGFSNNNVKEVADRLSKVQGGFRVIVPDFYRGEFWHGDPDVFPPPE